VALLARDEAQLRSLAGTLVQAGLPHQLIVEADAPYTGQAMALGIEPMERRALKKILGRYPLIT
jgi:hypothetical protein